MRFIAFAYNLFTLSHIIAYTNDVWGRENVDIIYSDIANAIPPTIIEDYKIHYIPANGVLERRRIDAIICSCRLSKQIWKEADLCISKTKEEVTLVVFRDNEVEEATLIELAFKKYESRMHLWIMEEGAGIYAQERPAVRYLAIKKLLYNLFGVSRYSLENHTQGVHPCVEKVICSNPELFKNKARSNINIENTRDVFQDRLNKYLIKSVCGAEKSERKYEYVFLTQPFDMFRDEYGKLLELHNRLLPEIFRILSAHGNVIIKLHPRENYDYQKYQNDRVNVSSEQEKILPFQCLMQYYDSPQMISMFSSASIGVKNDSPSIYLFKLFEIPGVNKLFDEKFYKENNIIACNTLKEFENLIINQKR